MNARDKLARFLPGWLLDREDIKHGFGSIAADAYRIPTNPTEAEAFNELVNEGNYTVFRRGWPDFMVFADQDDVFFMEVKKIGDVVRPSQRVVLETLQRLTGLDVYIRWSNGTALSYEQVGASPPFWERKKRWA